MTELFLAILNTGIMAGWVVLAVLLLRLLLRKAPAWVKCALWGIVGLRLIWPFRIESIFSLIPSTQTLPAGELYDHTPELQTGIRPLDALVNPVFTHTFESPISNSANPLQVAVGIGAILWLAGVAAMAVYTLVSYLRLRRRVRVNMPVEEKVYLCDQVKTPFILGIARPRIYLPSALPEEKWESILAHERAHLARKDHWWKPMGFLLLAVYWFHPLLWLAYLLLCRDIETACDERVIREMSAAEKKRYTQTLLECSLPGGRIAACPLAFGEIGVKQRIRAVLDHQKPALWIILASVAVCAVAAVCFLTSPMERGIRDLRVAGSDAGTVTLELPYADLWGGYSVEPVPEGAGEYTGSGEVPYDGALGKYRMRISFGDVEPTSAFREKYPVGAVCTLENVPEHFGGAVKIRIAYPADHGFVIYVGSDVPFTAEEQQVGPGDLEGMIGSIRIELRR